MDYFNLYGPLNDLGYGIFTRGLIKGLHQTGHTKFHLSCIGGPQMEDKDEEKVLQQQSNVFLWNRKAPSVAIWHEFDLNKFSGDKIIGFPIFETTGFVPLAKNYLSQMNAVFVMSHWAKKVVEENIGNGVPVHVVPGAANLIDSPEVNDTKKAKFFTFLSVGKYEVRKSPLETIQAYVKAFEGTNAETRLLCHYYNPFDPNFVKNISQVLGMIGLKVMNSTSNTSIIATKGNCIVEIPKGRISAVQLSQLYKYCHVGVFPAKAEGWNLPLMEAIQSGLPCIATNYSAHTEYLNSDYQYNESLLLNNYKMVVANDGMFFHGNRGDWAVIDQDELVEKFRYSYNNYNEVVEKFDNTRIKETFTWKNTALKFIDALNRV